MPVLIDEVAKGIALSSWTLPERLHVPIAAADEQAIRVSRQVLARGSPNKAFLVTVPETAVIDPLLPISDHANAGIFHARQQVWVHIAYNRYRHAYNKAFPGEDIAGRVLSHAMNRRTAALKGFDYVRITPRFSGRKL
jgi:hypothetical protein